jgi:hypothetical protein
MSQLNNTLNKFLAQNQETPEGQEICDLKTGKCYIKTKDGLIERTLIEKKLVVEDGRELLREENPISHSRKQFLG